MLASTTPKSTPRLSPDDVLGWYLLFEDETVVYLLRLQPLLNPRRSLDLLVVGSGADVLLSPGEIAWSRRRGWKGLPHVRKGRGCSRRHLPPLMPLDLGRYHVSDP